MNVERIASFCEGASGGNPAGVALLDALPSDEEMLHVAAEVGYSETAFAAPDGEGWRVRYFAPAAEIPFCGHATIALGAALGAAHGAGRYALTLNDAEITVDAAEADGVWSATLASPPTWHAAPEATLTDGVREVFGVSDDDLSAPMMRISAGADMIMIPLANPERLTRLDYELDAGARLLNDNGIVGAYFVHAPSPDRADVRMAFPTGGVFEDPATGAAAAAYAGWLRDTGVHIGRTEIRQGVQMGAPSRLIAETTPETGAAVNVTGATRRLS